MFKTVLLSISITLTFFSLSSYATTIITDKDNLKPIHYDFKQGTHYKVIKKPQTTKHGVQEFFSFYCPHCFRFEAVITTLGKSLPNNILIEKSHVNFMRGIPQAIQDGLTRALLIAKEEPNSKKIITAIFNYIHKENKTFNTWADIRNLLVVNGVAPILIDSLSADPSITARIIKMQSSQKALIDEGVLEGVPTLVVNGRYKINTQSIHSEKELKALTNYLLKL